MEEDEFERRNKETASESEYDDFTEEFETDETRENTQPPRQEPSVEPDPEPEPEPEVNEPSAFSRFWSSLFDSGLREEEKEEEAENKYEGNYAQILWSKYVDPRHCPYCFSYTTSKSYREESRPGSHNIYASNVAFSLDKIKIFVCPNCKKDLPPDFFKSKSSSIAIVGGREAGKSTFITVFCELLLHRNSILNELGVFGSIVNQEGREFFNKNRSTLVKQNLALEGTAEDQPVIIRLESKYHSKVLYLSFIDSPGESFEDADKIAREMTNVQLAAGIIFLINPLDVSGISNLLIEEKGRGAFGPQKRGIDNFDIIQNLYRLLTVTGRTKINQPIKIPTAFCLSRADMLESSSSLYLPNDLEPNLVVKKDLIDEMNITSDDLVDFLEDVEPRLLNLIEKRFGNYRLLPLSALGKEPVNQGGRRMIKGGIEPKGVLQPLLWILIQTNFLDQ